LKKNRAPLGLKNAEATGGERQKQEQANINRATATSLCV
jgi:hypothetical protein